MNMVPQQNEYIIKLEAALRRAGNLHTLEDILDAIEAGTMQGFAEGNTWVVTQISEYPRKRVLDIVYLVGNLDDALSVYRRVIDFATEHNCSLVRAFGRRGWNKFVEEYGWTVPNVVYHLEID